MTDSEEQPADLSRSNPKTQWGITPPISNAPATEADIALNQEMIDELKRQNSFEAPEESHKRWALATVGS